MGGLYEVLNFNEDRLMKERILKDRLMKDRLVKDRISMKDRLITSCIEE